MIIKYRRIFKFRKLKSLFPRNLVLLGCISNIVDFDIFGTLWAFTVNVPRMEKPYCWFALTKMCEKHRWKSDILSKDACHWSISLLKSKFSAGAFHPICLCILVVWFGTLATNGSKKLIQQKSVINIWHLNIKIQHCNLFYKLIHLKSIVPVTFLTSYILLKCFG